MARIVGIGYQDFEQLISDNSFYIDKSYFIRDWWESKDRVTLITRPRRFGKTLTISMLDYFFSIQHVEDRHIFEGLSIWEQEKYQKMQGTYPVINLSFANIKDKNVKTMIFQICKVLSDLYLQNYFLLNSDILLEEEKNYFKKMAKTVEEKDAPMAIHHLAGYMSRYYDKKVIILLDEYDTPIQEAYVNGCGEEIVSFTRNLFNSTFKTNPYLERAIMTGITRVSKESIFSDLNNLEVVTTTCDKYADVFGFTEKEVFAAMNEMNLTNVNEVKEWYDGFVFGNISDIYNPWSIINYLAKRKAAPYWANSSSNRLVGKLLQKGNPDIKIKFEQLLAGKSITSEIDEEIVYDQLEKKRGAIWSLLLASGYLKVLDYENGMTFKGVRPEYELALTNYEVRIMFKGLVYDWFDNDNTNAYNDFIKALLLGDLKAMNIYMNRVALKTFSYFDTGNQPSEAEPERFYHGFVLGLIVELERRYTIKSNRESGFGRYDVMMIPKNTNDDGIIMEFKVRDLEDEKDLRETVQAALKQIEEKEYAQELISHGVPEKNIRKYGFAFEGKKVQIGE